MLLRKITLEEFGAYRGKQSLDLTPKKNKPIILIGGLNGCGKTTLLDAIQLVLYGNRARCSGRGTKAYETYLRESINRKADPARGSSITLEFTVLTGGHEHHYRVVRSWHISGKTLKEFLNVYVDESYGERAKLGRTVRPESDFNRLLSEGWADHIESLLPLEIASLAFFDGEKIESLADPERAASVIESAVHSLLGVSTVQQLRNDLLALQRRQKLSDEEQHLLDNIRAQETERDAVLEAYDVAHQELGHSRSELGQAQRTLESLERAFAKEGGNLFTRRVELENDKEQILAQLAQLRAELIQLATGPLPLLLAAPLLSDLREQAAKEQQAQQSAHVLEVLAQRDTWLLDLLPDAQRIDVVAQLEADRAQRAKSTELAVNLQLPHDATAQLAVLDELLERDTARGDHLLKTLADLTAQLDQLDRQLAGVPAQHKVEALQQSREEQILEVARAQAACDRAAAQLEELKRRREYVTTLLERAHKEFVRTKVKAEEVERVIKYSEKARDTLERFGTALLQRHISRLEVAVLQSFKILMRKQSLVHDLRIDTGKFTLSLADADGEDIDPARLSAGERQLLAVSLLWGLMRVAGNRLPSVIDTPLGRLDSRHREHLVDRYFPHASNQVLLLSTDEEIDEYLLGRLKKSIAHTYTLVHDDREFTTSVVEGYWWNEGVQHAG
ncbi:DNA sulfur modification protein DndD [Streptomyces sp. BV129]|uniref:DNA sulfur modification protein DndD n=1 Tax=Streptomyces sp. BV129 TaxID=2849671 RepID=UPI001C2E5FFD|nr:DNA sulfur modification protein DndD [Streptomyces sp. BV129]MBV1949365.1 DNA sulfur modification protein DndD [Streptomyces sp. BV129]MBV1949486.1 DNA sulfur modification protein DndD [Streptomyces sp. BV129]